MIHPDLIPLTRYATGEHAYRIPERHTPPRTSFISRGPTMFRIIYNVNRLLIEVFFFFLVVFARRVVTCLWFVSCLCCTDRVPVLFLHVPWIAWWTCSKVQTLVSLNAKGFWPVSAYNRQARARVKAAWRRFFFYFIFFFFSARGDPVFLLPTQ